MATATNNNEKDRENTLDGTWLVHQAGQSPLEYLAAFLTLGVIAAMLASHVLTCPLL